IRAVGGRSGRRLQARSLRKRSWPYRSIGERIPEAPRRTAEEGEVSLTKWSLTADALHRPMSALPPKADMCRALAHVCFGPEADSCVATSVAIRPPPRHERVVGPRRELISA